MPRTMRPAVPEKILKVVDDIATQGNVALTRLTVLKKWFEQQPEGCLPVDGAESSGPRWRSRTPSSPLSSTAFRSEL